ncbi:MAG TPA: GtrA family protein [Terriglobales bacterium]|nr:GtrA family protein [Terriglobales bacterium]
MPESLQQASLVRRLIRHLSPVQFGRYILVGIWNTVFGYTTYAALTFLLTPHLPYAYIFATVLASFLNITVAFLGYKWVIFKTKGNYLREWVRCVLVYSGGIVTGILLLPPLVYAVRHSTRFDTAAPYIAGAVLMGLNLVIGFVGHKTFSFQSPQAR